MKTSKFQHSTSREIPKSKFRSGPAYNCGADSVSWSLKLGASLVMGIWCLALPFAPSANAQNYSIDWYKISGGGGTSSNGQYTVSGTIGQHDAGGPMTGGNYSLTGGFWALISVVQTPGAPTLHISHPGSTVTVFWQDVAGWHLQQNNNLAAPTGWVDSTGVTTSSGTNYLNLVSPTGQVFFRLINP